MHSRVYREVAEGLVLSIRVTPKSPKDEIAGVHGAADCTTAIAVKVSAPPDRGKANRAVIEVLAKALNAPKSSLTIVLGATSRNKNVLVGGKPRELQATVEQLIQDLKS